MKHPNQFRMRQRRTAGGSLPPPPPQTHQAATLTGINQQLKRAKDELEAKKAEVREIRRKLEEDTAAFRSAEDAPRHLTPQPEDLRESDDALRFAAAAAGIGTWHWDLVKDEVSWSEEGRQLLGSIPGPVTYRDFLHLVAEEDRQRVDEAVRHALTAKSDCFVEMRVSLPDGRLRWLLSKGRALYNEQGRPYRMHGIVIDVTERRAAEEAIRISERKFSQVFRAAPALLMISTLEEGKVLDINEAAAQILGYQRDEILGRTVRDLDLWESISDRDKIRALLKKDGFIRGLEVRFRAKTGQAVVGLYSAELLEIEGVPCILSLMRDITERKSAEEALTRAKEEWERTFDSVPDFIAILDNRNRITRVNRAMAERLGRNASDLIDLPCYTAFHGTDLPPAYCPHMTSGAFSSEQMTEVHEPSSDTYFLVSHTPLLAPDGKASGVVLVARDITERKLAEQEIARLNADLAARAAELEAANKDLEAFNFTVAHDLRRPLNMIYGHCQSIEMECGGRVDPRCLGHLHDTYKGVLRMSGLIDSLLNFSRLNRVELRRETVDLSEMAQTVAMELKGTEPERGAVFRVTEGITVRGDRDLLRIVLDNLLGNAWKYTGMRQDAVIEFGTAEVDGKRACFVRDNGIGFDMADAGRLFAPFQRLPGSEIRSGSGIGLATVERIISRHGGRVWAEGESGRGATFYFSIPVGDAGEGQ